MNTTDQNIKRNLGGGYKYEWLLGAEIALVALHHAFELDWGCREEEVPVPLVLRQWLGSTRGGYLLPESSMTNSGAKKSDASNDAADTQSPDSSSSARQSNSEDINLVSGNGRKLHVQVKSGELTGKKFVKAIARFIDLYVADPSDARFLLVVEEGLPFGIDRKVTLAGALAWNKAQSETEQKKSGSLADIEALLQDRVPNLSDDFCEKVHLSRGPLYQRVLSALRSLVARAASLNLSVEANRKLAKLVTGTYIEKYSGWACRESEPGGKAQAQAAQSFRLSQGVRILVMNGFLDENPGCFPQCGQSRSFGNSVSQ